MQAYIFLETNKKCLYGHCGNDRYNLALSTLVDFIHHLFITQDHIAAASPVWNKYIGENQDNKLISIYDIHIERNLV